MMGLLSHCGNCEHFDGEGWCALLLREKLIPGYIVAPTLVYCAKHEPSKTEELDGPQAMDAIGESFTGLIERRK